MFWHDSMDRAIDMAASMTLEKLVWMLKGGIRCFHNKGYPVSRNSSIFHCCHIDRKLVYFWNLDQIEDWILEENHRSKCCRLWKHIMQHCRYTVGIQSSVKYLAQFVGLGGRVRLVKWSIYSQLAPTIVAQVGVSSVPNVSALDLLNCIRSDTIWCPMSYQ